MKINRKNILFAGIGSLLTLVVAFTLSDSTGTSEPIKEEITVDASKSKVFHQASQITPSAQSVPDFTVAAEESVHAVVHIRTQYERKPSMYDYFYDFHDFFERRRQPQSRKIEATGSGVIISEDGYIVTNNHVVEDADNIKVTLNNKRTYDAQIVGTDPSTDLAVVKIEAEELPYLVYGDSDKVQIGEWVLAVGNPFNLTSTVTAGIVSAKARNINILGPAAGGSASAIESFIQTDAAVNRGNSGGALVNTQGELVGINAAIASGTGYYAGYSFAIPVNIVRKVVDDLLQFGRVQRAYIGVRIADVTSELADKEGMDKIEGVFVAGVTDSGAAQKAGIEEGDVIVGLENKPVNSVSELLGEVGQYRPGDVVDVKVKRNGKYKTYRMTLTDGHGNKTLSKEAPREEIALFGATFESADAEALQKLNLDHGVKVKSLERNSRLATSGIEEGFIITRIDKKVISSPEDIKQILEGKRGGVLIEGVYPNGTVAYYGFGL